MVTQDQFPFGGAPETGKNNSLLYAVLILSIIAAIALFIGNVMKRKAEEREQNCNGQQ